VADWRRQEEEGSGRRKGKKEVKISRENFTYLQ
jgi:hypothetical protein